MLAANPGPAGLRSGLRPASWRAAGSQAENGPMRAFRVVLAVVGARAVVLAVAVNLASGHYTDAGWVLVVPLRFYAVACSPTCTGQATRRRAGCSPRAPAPSSGLPAIG